MSGNVKKILIIVFVSLVFNACAPYQGRYLHSPALLPGTMAEMNTPGFWIGIHENPDEIILDKDGIEAFNQAVRESTGMIKDIAQYASSYQGQWLAETLSAALASIMKRDNYSFDGTRADAAFYEHIGKNMDIGAVPEEVKVRFGLVVAYTHQRILPVRDGLYSKKLNHAFDRLQNSALDIGTPVAILHETRDGRWFYVDAPLCAGWVLASDVGICSREQIEHYTSAEPFVVTLSAKADIFLNEESTMHHAYVRMGSRFVIQPPENKDVVEILLPVRDMDGMCVFASGFVSRSDIHLGYLPYTPRSIINQAFKLLNTPYGWGGMFGEQDCSRFIQEIFATAGICFPRNSTQQAKVGRLAAFFNNGVSEQDRIRQIIAVAQGGITTMQMKGHIMLYLGSYNGELYAIHDMWGYAEPTEKGEDLRVVNRVVVTDLSLGRGGSSGTLLGRLVTVRVVAADPQRHY
ncbi:MAG TPA: hypothetical protein ENN05_02970 [Deltaproteobacteria bacterium]|nr:hypothetical protein [Deltaproteobacteria bacterium]